jgi:hypothetical protein
MVRKEESMLFIVSGVHTKHIVTGLNIQNYMMAFDAVSREEAMGKYILLANEKFPDHDLFQRPNCMSIEEAQQVIQPDNAQ